MMNEKEALILLFDYIFKNKSEDSIGKEFTFFDKRINNVTNDVNYVKNEMSIIKNEVSDIKEMLKDTVFETKDGVKQNGQEFVINEIGEFEPKVKSSTKKSIKNKSKCPNDEVMERILDIIPEYSQKEWENHEKELKQKIENSNKDINSLGKIANEQGYTLRKIYETLGCSRSTVQGHLNKLCMNNRISRFKLASYQNSPVIYYKLKEDDDVQEEKRVINASRKNGITDEMVLDCIPTMTEKELANYQEKLWEQCKYKSNKVLVEILANDCTSKNISEKLGCDPYEVNNRIKSLVKQELITSFQVNDGYRSPRVYVKVEKSNKSFSKKITKNPEDELYQFKDMYKNLGYDLINGLYVKPRQGSSKNLYFNAKQLHEFTKLVSPSFTVKSHDKLVKEMKNQGLVADGEIEAFCYRLVHGHFDEVINEYINYQKKLFNPDFNVNGDFLLVNKEHMVQITDVKDILKGIPYGDENKLGKYTRELIDKKYTEYPSEAIHTIIENSDMVNDMLKDKLVVENSPQKRREKGWV